MKKLITITLALLLAFSGSVALAASLWPASCSGYACVNNHLNDLNTRVNKAYVKTVVVSQPYDFGDQPMDIQTVTPCGLPGSSGFKGTVVGGGINIAGADGQPDSDWYIVTEYPTMMNSWSIHASTTVVGGEVPTVTTFAVCLKAS